MDLTQEIILQHGRFSPYKREMEDPTLVAEAENSFCGDTLKICLKIVKGQVSNVSFSGEGCLISQASASLLLGEMIKVKDLNKIKKFDKNTVFKLLEIQLTPSRIKCALLPLEALKKVFEVQEKELKIIFS